MVALSLFRVREGGGPLFINQGQTLSNQAFESLGESQDFTQRSEMAKVSFKREVGSFTFKTEVCSQHKRNAKRADVTNIHNAVRLRQSHKLEFQTT
jgi:hypothetical protein